MITIHNRLDPASSEISRSVRRHNLSEIAHALELADQIGVAGAAQATGINYRRLARFRLADRRSRMSLQEALDDLEDIKFFTLPGPCNRPALPEAAARVARKRGADLMIRVEAAREGCRIANRTGANVWRCIWMAAERRGLRGKSVCELVREGRIAKHWIL
jgi:hypothetical protein